MQIAAPYTPNSEWKDIPNEYNLTWGPHSNEEKLLDFCEAFPKKRINISTQENVDFDLKAIATAKIVNPNIHVCLNIHQQFLIPQLKEKNIPFYFDSSYPCYNYTILAAMAELGVSDIYICDDLFYNLESVKQFAQQHNIQIRIILNRIASTAINKYSDIKSPYVSPRDMDILDQYIDIAEFDCGKDCYNWNKFNVLYKTFFINKEWFGDLRELNGDLDFSVFVYSTVPDHIKWKIRCRRRCSLGEPCGHCEMVVNMAKELYEENISIKSVKS